MPQLIRALVTLSLLVGAAAWGCSKEGCTDPSAFNNSVADDFKAQASLNASGLGSGSSSSASSYTPSNNSGLGFTPSGQSLVTDTKAMPKAGQFNAKRGVIDWDSMAAKGGQEARGVLARFNRIQPKVAPSGAAASTLTTESLVNPSISSRAFNVIQPDSIRAMRGIASEARMPRTLDESGVPN